MDWETAYRNDPFVDVAIVAEHCAVTPELEEALLEAWSHRGADPFSISRLRVMRVLTRLYYAGLLIVIGSAGKNAPPIADLSVPAEQAFGMTMREQPGARAAHMITLGKMQLARFLRAVDDPRTAAALAALEASR